ncbi:MAG: serine/threonine-protein kinase [Verrucomicrobiota bacterium]|nr:serine/threonine-protein kinase [Verrucomicrobiota bacterium]
MPDAKNKINPDISERIEELNELDDVGKTNHSASTTENNISDSKKLSDSEVSKESKELQKEIDDEINSLVEDMFGETFSEEKIKEKDEEKKKEEDLLGSSNDTCHIKKARAVKIKTKAKEKIQPQLAETGEPPKLKIHCHECGQKLDVTDAEPFSEINCPTCNSSVLVPMVFETFLLEEVISESDSSCVFRAVDLALDREVAVKILNSDIAEDVEKATAFLENARKIAALNHPNILPIYSCGESEGQPYIVMQYMEAHSLEDQLKKSRKYIPIKNVNHTITEVLKGLQYAHANNILHLNIKPSNILMGGDRSIKVSDFGLSAGINNIKTGKEVNQFANYQYVSPEKVNGNAEHVYSDIYSLGATCYHLLTNRTPFGGTTAEETINNRFEADIIAPKEFRMDIPQKLNDSILKMLSIFPSARPQTYKPLISSFEKFAKENESKTSKPTSAKTKPSKSKGRSLNVRGSKGKILKINAINRAAQTSCGSRRIQKKQKNNTATFINTILAIILVLIVSLILWKKFTPVSARNSDNVFEGSLNTSHTIDNSTNIERSPSSLERSENLNIQSTNTGDTTATNIVGSYDNIQTNESQKNAIKNVILRSKQRPVDTAKRPQPSGLNFDSVTSKLKQYVKTQHPKMYDMEEFRIKEIRKCKKYLIKMMSYIPFRDINGIKINNGLKTLKNASIEKCNKQKFLIITGKLKKTIDVEWKNIPFEQYVKFFEFYINKRRNLYDKRQKGSKTDIANDCFRLALLCDWYKDKNNALKYGVLAKKYDSNLGDLVDSYIPTLSFQE